MINHLKALRTEMRFRQIDIANGLGVSRQTVRNWERGKAYPHMLQLNQLRNFYKSRGYTLSASDFYTLREAKPEVESEDA